MGEERVLRGGDNVPVAATEASLSEIKHDEPPRGGPAGGREGSDEGTEETPHCPRHPLPLPINFVAFLGKLREAPPSHSHSRDISPAISRDFRT